MPKAPKLTEARVRKVVTILDGWTGKLTWDRLRITLQFELGHPYTKAGLRQHPEIVTAWDSAQKRLKVKIGNQKPRKHGDGALAHAHNKIAKLEATIVRLESEKELFLDQFLRWSYNAVSAGMTEEQLNRPIQK